MENRSDLNQVTGSRLIFKEEIRGKEKKKKEKRLIKYHSSKAFRSKSRSRLNLRNTSLFLAARRQKARFRSGAKSCSITWGILELRELLVCDRLVINFLS